MLAATEHTYPRVNSMVWECCSSLQICLSFLGVLPKGTVNLLVEVGIPVVDEVHILVCMKLAPPAVVVAAVLPACKCKFVCTSMLQNSLILVIARFPA